MVPELVDKFTNKTSAKKTSTADESAKAAAAKDLSQKLNIPSEEE